MHPASAFEFSTSSESSLNLSGLLRTGRAYFWTLVGALNSVLTVHGSVVVAQLTAASCTCTAPSPAHSSVHLGCLHPVASLLCPLEHLCLIISSSCSLSCIALCCCLLSPLILALRSLRQNNIFRINNKIFFGLLKWK